MLVRYETQLLQLGWHFKTIPATIEYPSAALVHTEPVVLELLATQAMHPGSHKTTVVPSAARAPASPLPKATQRPLKSRENPLMQTEHEEAMEQVMQLGTQAMQEDPIGKYP